MDLWLRVGESPGRPNGLFSDLVNEVQRGLAKHESGRETAGGDTSWDVVPGKPRMCHVLYLSSLQKWQGRASRAWGVEMICGINA